MSLESSAYLSELAHRPQIRPRPPDRIPMQYTLRFPRRDRVCVVTQRRALRSGPALAATITPDPSMLYVSPSVTPTITIAPS